MLVEPLLAKYANRILHEIPGYEGRVGGLKLRPLRGAYELRNLRLENAADGAPPAFLEIRSAGARVSMAALFKRVLATEVWADGYTLNITAGERHRARRRALAQAWTDRAKKLFPIRLDELSLRNGTLNVLYTDVAPPAVVWVDHIQLLGRNLTNRQHLRSENYASWNLRADFMGSAPVEALLRTNVLAPTPSFDIRGRIWDLALPRLNDLLHAVANIDIIAGTFAAHFDLALHEGDVSGFVETNYTDLELVRWDEGKPWSTLKRLRHGLFARGVESLEDERETLRMRIPIAGRLGDVKLDLPSAVASVLNNAFFQSLEPALAHVLERSRRRRGQAAPERPSFSHRGPHHHG